MKEKKKRIEIFSGRDWILPEPILNNRVPIWSNEREFSKREKKEEVEQRKI